jgi:two-component system phosphate regulon response regulator OmpR
MATADFPGPQFIAGRLHPDVEPECRTAQRIADRRFMPVRQALRAALEAASYKVIEAPDGESGLTQAAQAGLIVLDLGLPGISGFEVLETLRKTSATPVIVLSGQEEVDAKIRALDLGATIMSPSPSMPASCWRACAPHCAARRKTPQRMRPPSSPSGLS